MEHISKAIMWECEYYTYQTSALLPGIIFSGLGRRTNYYWQATASNSSKNASQDDLLISGAFRSEFWAWHVHSVHTRTIERVQL